MTIGMDCSAPFPRLPSRAALSPLMPLLLLNQWNRPSCPAQQGPVPPDRRHTNARDH